MRQYSFNRDRAVKLLKEQGYNDPEHEIDWDSYSDDIPLNEWLLNEYGIVLKGLKEHIEEIKAIQEQQKQEENKRIKEEENKLLEELKKEKAKKIIDITSFNVWREYLKAMVQSEDIHFLVGLGGGGLGKSYTTINALKKMDVDYSYLNSKVTPLALYKFLYSNKDKVILFDDILGLMDNEIIISILLSALWSATNKRIIHYETTAKVFEDLALPSSFEFTGKIIVLTNQFNLKNKYLNALKDRGFFWEFVFSYAEKIKVMKEIIRLNHDGLSFEDRQKILTFLIDNSSPATKDFSFRVLVKAYSLFKYNNDKWQQLVKSLLKDDERFSFVWAAQKNNTANASCIFENSGYGSRRTYFNILKKVKQEAGET